jgi:outer membrane protein assembly factor BamB
LSPSLFSGGARARRRWPLRLAVATLVSAGAALAAWLLFFHAPGNVSHAGVEFTAPKPAPPPKTKQAESTGLDWPLYGYGAQRTRYMPNAHVRPPYRRIWRFRGSSLIEFQPVLAKGLLFMLENNGIAVAINAQTGKIRWRRSVGALAASSPAWSGGRVYAIGNKAGSAGIASAGPGKLWCLDAKTGRVIWAAGLGSASESSPLIAGGRVYLGSQDGTVYALRASDGRTIWRHQASGAVKAGLALSQGRLYFGDYSGEMTALRASNGSVIWRTGTSGRSFGRSGTFYATPAIAFGRVYAGNTDGFIYSFASSNGQLAWSHATGGYVYSAPAVAALPGMRPAIFAGSYSGQFLALDARSGSVIWSYSAGGTISGAPSLIGDIVYFSTLSQRTTTGLNARSGHMVWKLNRGAFNPAISDGKRLYITGYNSLYGFEHRGG